jgi:ABC-type polysaccharide/polyol phosphate transport system ATPase subunit
MGKNMAAVLVAESVSKQFHLRRDKVATLQGLLLDWATGRREGRRTLWALRDVSFSVEQGQVLGVIGHNGAGKSTLLRLLCNLGRPSSGRIHRLGQVSGLLELGGGVQPDLTGRQNIITVGLLNGLTKRQVREQQEEIIAFAELEDFIDQPVRTYSSGMFVRLAFAVATHFDPDVLLRDEVLAGGDSRFQQKCMGRLKNFRAAGKTLLITSHDTKQIRSLCDAVLVLEEGRVAMLGDPESAIHCYTDLMRQRTDNRAAQLAGGTVSLGQVVEQGSRQGTQEASIIAVNFYNRQHKPLQYLRSGDGLIIELDYALAQPLSDMILTLGIYSETHVKCWEIMVPSIRDAFGSVEERETLSCYLPEVVLLPGPYFVNVGLYPTDWSYVYDYHWQIHSLLVVDDGAAQRTHQAGVVSLQPVWSAISEHETAQVGAAR